MASILPILGFLGLSILELGRGTRQTDRQTLANAHHFIMPPTYEVRSIIMHLLQSLTNAIRRWHTRVRTTSNISYSSEILLVHPDADLNQSKNSITWSLQYVLDFVTLNLWSFDLILIGGWGLVIPVASSVTVVSALLVLSCGQTHIHTESHTDASKHSTHQWYFNN